MCSGAEEAALWENTFGLLLADETSRETESMLVMSVFLLGGETYTFAEFVTFPLFFPGRIRYTFIILASSVNYFTRQESRVSSFKQLADRRERMRTRGGGGGGSSDGSGGT